MRGSVYLHLLFNFNLNLNLFRRLAKQAILFLNLLLAEKLVEVGMVADPNPRHGIPLSLPDRADIQIDSRRP